MDQHVVVHALSVNTWNYYFPQGWTESYLGEALYKCFDWMSDWMNKHRWLHLYCLHLLTVMRTTYLVIARLIVYFFLYLMVMSWVAQVSIYFALSVVDCSAGVCWHCVLTIRLPQKFFPFQSCVLLAELHHGKKCRSFLSFFHTEILRKLSEGDYRWNFRYWEDTNFIFVW